MTTIALMLAATLNLPPFGEVNVIDTVYCTKTDHGFVEMPAGVSEVTTILGRPCRHIPVQEGEMASMFSYRLGAGKGLKPNGSYVIVMDYPDDLPRNYVIVNRATDSHRAFSTGASLGDAWQPKYVDNHPETIAVPQSGRWEQWMQYTSLQDWTRDYGEGKATTNGVDRIGPEDGFDFAVAQYSRNHDPYSQGVAVSKILLCEIPDETKCYAELALPPSPLPQRHIFWREEMSDGPAIRREKELRYCVDQLDWIRHKCRQMKMLGMNVYTKDLLEFGHVQHWDPDYIRPGWANASTKESNELWGRIVDMVTKDYGFAILPYYEWCGNIGPEKDGKKTYGLQKRAETLSGEADYTHIWWTEKSNLDITDPEALEETKNLLRGTILRFKDRGRFLGAFFRTRPTQFPISFSDAARARFGAEANGGRTPTRDDLKGYKDLYAKYIDWWYVKRAEFLAACVKFLRDEGVDGAEVILDAEPSETGPGLQGGAYVADDPAAVGPAFAAAGLKPPKNVVSLADAVAQHLYLKGRSEPSGTWGKWEWQHAVPADRPLTDKMPAGVTLAMPVNRLYSVGDPDAFDAYANAGGVETVIRHHSLNEHNVKCTIDGKEVSPLGYDMSDTVKAGRASMMVEVNAMANGDPANLGYLIGSCFARGFPGPAREFNRNFLALPALPSTVVKGASSDPEVVLREIDCSKAGVNAKYYALVHTGKTAKQDVAVKFPLSGGELALPVDGGKVKVAADGTVVFKTLEPWQLRAFVLDLRDVN